jgi:hypothetical protein
LRLVLGVDLPLSIAAMPPVSLVGLSWAMDPSDRSSGDRACKGTCPSRGPQRSRGRGVCGRSLTLHTPPPPGSHRRPVNWPAARSATGVSTSPLSIPAMPPVSLVGLSWAIDPDRRLAAALTHVPLNGRLVRRRRASNVRVERLKGRFPKGGVSGDSLQPVVARGEPVRLVWPQWQGVGTVSVQQLVSDFPFDVGRRGYAVGSAVLEAVLPPNHGPTSLCPWL